MAFTPEKVDAKGKVKGAASIKDIETPRVKG